MSTTFLFDPGIHLSVPDAARLRSVARAAGLRPGEYIETAVKRRLFRGAPEDAGQRTAECGGKEVAR